MAGICNTDLEIVRGYMGYEGTLGHEFVGEVVQGPPTLLGQRITGEINLACGHCPSCQKGQGRHCPNRSVLGILNHEGCFAEYVTLPAANLHPIPAQLPDELACFVEPVAAAFEILEQVPVSEGQPSLVLGDGKLGLLIAQVLHQRGLAVTVLGRHPSKLALAAAQGMNTTLEPPGERFPLVVEATGSESGLKSALALTQPRGTLVLKSTYQGAITVDMSPLVIDEIALLGSRCGPFPPAIAALAAGRVDPLPLISQVVPLAQGPAAMAQAQQKGTLKVLLAMQ